MPITDTITALRMLPVGTAFSENPFDDATGMYAKLGPNLYQSIYGLGHPSRGPITSFRAQAFSDWIHIVTIDRSALTMIWGSHIHEIIEQAVEVERAV